MSVASTTPRVSVKMVSDAICPFCYVGYKNYNSGLALAKKNNVPIELDLEFKPFMLDPVLTREPVSLKKRLAEKYGGESKVKGMTEMMSARGKEVGINFDFEGTISQTHDYHRLLAAAYAKGGEALQRKLAEALFIGHFEGGNDPGQRPYLAQVAVETGVFETQDKALDFFKSNEFDKEVNEGYQQARALGISGVPFFIFQNKYAVSGAQPPEAFAQLFEKLSKEHQPEEVSLEGAACEVGKPCNV